MCCKRHTVVNFKPIDSSLNAQRVRIAAFRITPQMLPSPYRKQRKLPCHSQTLPSLTSRNDHWRPFVKTVDGTLLLEDNEASSDVPSMNGVTPKDGRCPVCVIQPLTRRTFQQFFGGFTAVILTRVISTQECMSQRRHAGLRELMAVRRRSPSSTAVLSPVQLEYAGATWCIADRARNLRDTMQCCSWDS